MKNAILVCSVLLGVYGLSSCTKLYNCTCTTETTDTVTKTKTSNTTVYKQRETSKKLADSKCQQNAFKFNHSIYRDVTTCTLEQVKAK